MASMNTPGFALTSPTAQIACSSPLYSGHCPSLSTKLPRSVHIPPQCQLPSPRSDHPNTARPPPPCRDDTPDQTQERRSIVPRTGLCPPTIKHFLSTTLPSSVLNNLTPCKTLTNSHSSVPSTARHTASTDSDPRLQRTPPARASIPPITNSTPKHATAPQTTETRLCMLAAHSQGKLCSAPHSYHLPLVESPQEKSVIHRRPSSTNLWKDAAQGRTLPAGCIVPLDQHGRKLPRIDHIHEGWPLHTTPTAGAPNSATPQRLATSGPSRQPIQTKQKLQKPQANQIVLLRGALVMHARGSRRSNGNSHKMRRIHGNGARSRYLFGRRRIRMARKPGRVQRVLQVARREPGVPRNRVREQAPGHFDVRQHDLIFQAHPRSLKPPAPRLPTNPNSARPWAPPCPNLILRHQHRRDVEPARDQMRVPERAEAMTMGDVERDSHTTGAGGGGGGQSSGSRHKTSALDQHLRSHTPRSPPGRRTNCRRSGSHLPAPAWRETPSGRTI